MFNRTTAVITMMLVLGSRVFPQSMEDRLAEFEFEKANLSHGFSVLIEKVSVTDELVKIDPDVEREPGSPDYQRELGSMRSLQRIIFSGKKKRLDAAQYSLLGDSNLANAWLEAQLVHENTSWYYEKKRGHPDQGIKQCPVKSGIVSVYTQTRWKHPFDLATSQGPMVQDDAPSMMTSVPLKIVREETLSDGRKRFLVFENTGLVCQITFSKTEDWMVEEVDFLWRKMTREEEMARKPLLNLTEEMLKSYYSYSTNRTEWKEVNGRWLPWATRVSYKSTNRPERSEYEIRFRDWKFKDDFDASLLDEANFTAEKIEASIDFKAIRNLFDRPN
jgi:hypothetical protein